MKKKIVADRNKSRDFTTRIQITINSSESSYIMVTFGQIHGCWGVKTAMLQSTSVPCTPFLLCIPALPEPKPFFFFFFFGQALGMCKFLGQGSKAYHSNDPSHCSDNAGSLTWAWALRAFQTLVLGHSSQATNSSAVSTEEVGNTTGHWVEIALIQRSKHKRLNGTNHKKMPPHTS